MHSEMILAVKLLNISISFQSDHFCVYMVKAPEIYEQISSNFYCIINFCSFIT